jgi:hypothetical protein
LPGSCFPSRWQLYRAATPDRRRGAGGGQPFIWAMRRWLPNGSRRPKSMP